MAAVAEHPTRGNRGRWLLPLGAALALVPGVPAAAALAAGVVLAVAFGNPYLAHTRKWTKTLLALSVMGLGAGMDLRAVARAGAHGVLFTVAGIAFCGLVGLLLGRALGVARDAGLLITVGTAICGGSAIAAVVPILEAEEHDVSVALGVVFLLNAAALVLFPALGHLLALGQDQFGLWAALAIHDTSSVVGAGLSFGARALEVATTVKLTRALWIVPVALAVGAWKRRSDAAAAAGHAKVQPPWFIAGFLAAAALVTFVPALRPAGHVLSLVARQGLVLTLFLIGAGLTRTALRQVGYKPLAFGVLLWAAVASASLAAVVKGLALV